jgi:hypothetical protein
MGRRDLGSDTPTSVLRVSGRRKQHIPPDQLSDDRYYRLATEFDQHQALANAGGVGGAGGSGGTGGSGGAGGIKWGAGGGGVAMVKHTANGVANGGASGGTGRTRVEEEEEDENDASPKEHTVGIIYRARTDLAIR